MRKGWRGSAIVVVVVLTALAFQVPQATLGAERPVRLTIELSWEVAATGDPNAPEAVLAPTEGRVVEVVSWPELDRNGPADQANPDGSWNLGRQRSGRVRARIEVPVGASLLLRAGERNASFPILDVVEGPRRTPVGMPLSVEVRRLPWDALEVQLEGSDGTIAPGTLVPITLAFNVLTPEPTEIALRYSVAVRPLRGGEPLWRTEHELVLPTNAMPTHGRVVPVPMPNAEGTYEVEVQASWQPAGIQREGSRLARWWRRRRELAADTVTRRLSLAVVGPNAPIPQPVVAPGKTEGIVDVIDLTRPKGFRPLASGRSPLDRPDEVAWTVPAAAFLESKRAERLWNLIGRVAGDPEPLATANGEGLAWTAASVRVPRPGRPHRLSINVHAGDPSELAVALVVPGERPRMLLDARGHGAPVSQGGAPAVLSWPVWPDAAEPILVVVNRSTSRPLWLGEAQLIELADDPPPLAVFEPPGGSKRVVGVLLTGPHALDRFGGANDHGPDDALSRARHLAAYLAHCGASSVILPAPSRLPKRTALESQAFENGLGPDPFDLLLRVLARSGQSALVEVRCDGPLPGLPPKNSPEALSRGLVLVNRNGKAETPVYNPLHPEVRAALTRHVVTTVERGAARHQPSGVLLRLGPGPTLAGRPDTGLDDSTFARFVRDQFRDGSAPGLDASGPKRFEARYAFVSGPGLVPWLTWRSQQLGTLYAELGDALNAKAPGTRLVVATPGLDDGPAGAEARRCDLAGLAPDQAWRAVGLDLNDWPTDEPSPLVLRGLNLSVGDLAHDLSTRSELDAQVVTRPRRGVLLGVDQGLGRFDDPNRSPTAAETLRLNAVSMAAGADGDEALGHALAVLDAHWTVVSAGAIVGQEERLRRFAQVFRALPVVAGTPRPPLASGAAVRSWTVDGWTYLALANDTPYSLQIATTLDIPSSTLIEDLGRGFRLPSEPSNGGGRQVVVELEPFGATALRVGASGVKLLSARPRFDDRTQSDRDLVSARLRRLAQGMALGPPNPGFEPEPPREGEVAAAGVVEAPPGWMLDPTGDGSATIVLDTAHRRSGQSSLRLEAEQLPAAVLSESFIPPASTLTLRAWFRADPPETPVRVRLEGMPGTPTADSVRLTAALPTRDRSEWTVETLRAAGLPTGGQGQVRLRLELLAPGRLWVDDLSVSGPGLLHARGHLTAALQAYGEGRYADFARLANSHWARRAAFGLDPNTDHLLETETAIRPEDAPTDLPTRRRLR